MIAVVVCVALVTVVVIVVGILISKRRNSKLRVSLELGTIQHNIVSNDVTEDLKEVKYSRK